MAKLGTWCGKKMADVFSVYDVGLVPQLKMICRVNVLKSPTRLCYICCHFCPAQIPQGNDFLADGLDCAMESVGCIFNHQYTLTSLATYFLEPCLVFIYIGDLYL